MHLRNKAFFAVAITWAFFLVLTYSNTIRDSMYIYIPLALFCALISCVLLYVAIITRIEKNNTKIAAIRASHDLALRIEAPGSDELASLGAQINGMLDSIQIMQQQNEQQIQKHHQDLQTKNELILKSKNITNELTNPQISLAWITHHDYLTSLPNRIVFNEMLNRSIGHAKRGNKNLAVLLVDIDNFKKVNNTINRAVGDLVLKEISQRLLNSLRSEDMLAKLDNDIFTILLADINKPKFASAVAEKLLHACSQPILIDGHEILLTISIGICIFPNDGDTLQTLLENVSSALFKAKFSGGNTYQFYAQEANAEAREYIQFKTDLIKAIENNELTLYYQPKMHIKEGTITGVEALIRWEHPTLGLINPAQFIPVAEEAGLISKIGKWTLLEACRTNKYWHDEGYEHLTVAVNLSPKEFNDPKICQIIKDVLEETGLNPKYLELEMTEKTIMDDIKSAQSKLEAIKETGVQIAIDHFGTGYTSISHLKQFPVNAIKIDQSFIKGIPNIPNDMDITSALIALVQKLNLDVIAEGVETAEQVQFLADHGCDIVQGYFLSHPLPAQKVILQLRKISDEILT